jgi:hypothetical protein
MCTCKKEINTLTRDERIILELIDQIRNKNKIFFTNKSKRENNYWWYKL